MGTSLVVQWLRLHTSNSPSFIGELRYWMPCGTTKKLKKKKNKKKENCFWLKLFKKIFIYLFGCTGVLVVAWRIFSCGMWDLAPLPGVEPGPLHWKCRVLATGPSGKSLFTSFQDTHLFAIIFWEWPVDFLLLILHVIMNFWTWTYSIGF